MANTESRVVNSYKNVISSTVLQMITLLISFATRIIFVKCFGEGYLGISGLFSNILSVLSLAELGIGGAMTYALYKPLAENDYQKITALMNYYKKLYNIIALVVLFTGICLVPFLDFFINLDQPIEHITLYYSFYLLESASSYLFVYKTTLLSADQKLYKTKICTTIFYVIRFVAQSFIAFILKNFTIYLFTQILCTILGNFAASKIVDRDYPFINDRTVTLNKSDRHEIWNNVKSLLSYQLGGVMINNTDNILISVLVGTVIVGYYSNYSLIVSSVSGFTVLIFNAIQGSVGNLAAKESSEKQYSIFKILHLMAFWIYGFCSICLLILSQDFIVLAYGENYKLDFYILITIVLNFYVYGILYPVYCYRTTVGLFKNTKYIMLITGILNLVLSTVLGIYIGLFGILISTSLARLLTNAWYEPKILYEKYFHENTSKYYTKQILYFILLFIAFSCTYCMTTFFSLFVSNEFILFVTKMLVCVVVPNLIFYIIFRKTYEFHYLFNAIKNTILNRNTYR